MIKYIPSFLPADSSWAPPSGQTQVKNLMQTVRANPCNRPGDYSCSTFGGTDVQGEEVGCPGVSMDAESLRWLPSRLEGPLQGAGLSDNPQLWNFTLLALLCSPSSSRKGSIPGEEGWLRPHQDHTAQKKPETDASMGWMHVETQGPAPSSHPPSCAGPRGILPQMWGRGERSPSPPTAVASAYYVHGAAPRQMLTLPIAGVQGMA